MAAEPKLASETCGQSVKAKQIDESSSKQRDPALVALGTAIRRARLASGMSQEALALKSEIERSYLSSVERGMQNVGVMALVRVAATLNITVAELVTSAGI